MSIAPRVLLTDFALANPLYAEALISVYAADLETWTASTTLATLYKAPTGTAEHANPLRLDGDGKWPTPAYVDTSVICRVTGAAVPSHDTGVISPPAAILFQGDWAVGEEYNLGDVVRDGAAGANTGALYASASWHTASSSWSTDLADERWQLFLAATASDSAGDFNVLDYGAVGDGVTDDTTAINAALAAVPAAGGEVCLPAGYTFRFSAPLTAKSGTIIAGGGILKALPFASWTANGKYWGVTNVNNEAGTITDENITVRDIVIDYSDFTSAPVGTRWCMYFRMARNVRNINVRTSGGTNHVAHKACDKTSTQFAYAVGFSNCGFDHWEQTNNAEVIGGYFESSSTNQMGNFNPELDNTSTGYTCAGIRVVGVEMNYTGVTPTSVQIEPLYNVGSSVSDVVVSGCIFRNTRLIMRGNTSGVSITGNTFITPGTGEVIASYTQLGGSPSGFSVTGNTIVEPETSGASGGVIRIEMDNATITGNMITGTGYAGQAIYRNTSKPNMLANRVETSPVPGTLQAGFRLLNGAANYISIEDASGTTGLRAYIQTDNSMVLASSDASGVARNIATMATRSSDSDFSWLTRHVFADLIRQSPQTGITAAGTTSGTATALTRNFCEVTTTAAGTGVRLPAAAAQSITGARIVVWNAGANTLNVFPMPSGQINALGADVADTIAAGVCKTYFAISSTLYRIET